VLDINIEAGINSAIIYWIFIS